MYIYITDYVYVQRIETFIFKEHYFTLCKLCLTRIHY